MTITQSARPRLWEAILIAILFLTSGAWLFPARAASEPASTFTYQGRLTDGGSPARGAYDMQFSLYDAPVNGNAVASGVEMNDVLATDGLFMVALDFGLTAFDGEARWLEISVRPCGSSGAYVTLSPRQPITAAPYALYSYEAARLAGTLPDGQLSSNIPRLNANQAFTGAVTFKPAAGSAPFAVSGTNLVKNLNADLLDGLHASSLTNARWLGGLQSSDFWKLHGNSNTVPGSDFVGTTDNKALEFKVNNGRALRLEPTATSPNLIGGAANNSVAPNVVGATIGGGVGNAIQADASFATLAGGDSNSISNRASYAAIPGGRRNVAGGQASFAAGTRAKAMQPGAFVWADTNNFDFASERANQFRVRASGGIDLVTAIDASGNPTADVRMTSTGGVSVTSINATTPALELRRGSIRVPGAGLGAGTPVFIHRATANNIWLGMTIIDHPLCNGDPNAILIVTQNFSPGGRTVTGLGVMTMAVGVLYTGGDSSFPAWFRGRWAIVNLTMASMAKDIAFNVLVVKTQ